MTLAESHATHSVTSHNASHIATREKRTRRWGRGRGVVVVVVGGGGGVAGREKQQVAEWEIQTMM